MSGTSLDGADAVVADFSTQHPRVLAFTSAPYPPDLREELLALNTAGANEIERAALASNRLAAIYADVAQHAMEIASVDRAQIAAIGCHGQTVRHRPDLGYTIQLNNPAMLAELTGCTVAADFRSRDIAAGGQGAPLVPAFHDGIFRAATEARVIVNIGGIANLTILEPGKPAWGFDCGPGNCLMDAWIAKHLQQSFDDNGAWAAEGGCLLPILKKLQGTPYFRSPPPKSTGRDLFSLAWLEGQLTGHEAPTDVQATLLALTAWSIADHIARYAPTTTRILVCGGGAQNAHLLSELSTFSSCAAVSMTDEFGVPAQQVEALAFAWFAKQAVEHRTLNLAATTGAKHDCVLGAIYPA